LQYIFESIGSVNKFCIITIVQNNPEAKQPRGESTRLAMQAHGLPLTYYRPNWHKLQGSVEPAWIQELRRHNQRKSRVRAPLKPAAGDNTKI
jgi:hypothetical protein